MRSELQKKYYIGTPRPGKWASVYAYKPQKNEFFNKRGEIFASIAMSSPDNFNLATAGNLILDHLHETYFENNEDKPLVALEKAVISTKKYLTKFLEHDKAAEEGIDVDLVVTVAHKGFLFFVVLGQSHIHIYRDGVLTDVAPHLKDPFGRGEIRVGSTMLKSADVLILSSPSVVRELTRDDLAELAISFSDEKLRQLNYSDESLISLLLVGYEVNRKEAEAEALLVEADSSQVPVAKSLSERRHLTGEGKNKITEQDAELDLETEESFTEEEKSDTNSIFDKILASSVFILIKNNLNRAKGYVNQTFSKVFNKDLQTKQTAFNEQETKEYQTEKTTFEENAEEKTYQVVINRIVFALTNAFRSVKSTVWDNWLGMKKEGVYLKGGRGNRNWRFIILVMVIAVLVIYLSVRTISENNARSAIEAEARSNIDSAVTIINKAEKEAPIIASSANNQDRKQGLLSQLQEAENKLNQASNVEIFAEEIASQSLKIQEIQDILNKIIAVKNPELIVDIAGNFPGAMPSDFAVFNNKIFISDSEYGKIYSVDYSGANLRELASGLSNPKTITVDSNGNIVFIDQEGDRRLGTVNSDDGSIARHSGTSEFRVGNVSQIDFADIYGGRIYGIDQSLKAVIMLQKSGDTYSIPEKRFELEELSTGVDINISDLKIYMLADLEQGLFRLLGENNDTPSLVGLNENENLFNATALDVDGVYVYIADPQNQRILVFNKADSVTSMSLVTQYKYRGDDADGFKDIKEIVADIDSKKLFVLDGTGIYSLALSSPN